MMNILLIEDNLSIIKGIKYNLEQNNYQVVAKTNISDSINYLNSNNKIDLIILDVTLPDGNGFNLYENNIKDLNIPIIILTAVDDEDNVVKGLELGVNEYITKPFSMKELLTRINRIMVRKNNNSTIKIKDITYNYDKMEVYKNNQKIELSSLELKILNLLFNNINKVVTRNLLLDKIWEWTGNDVDDHTITVYLKRIREKINTDFIITVKGIGYRIDNEK